MSRRLLLWVSVLLVCGLTTAAWGAQTGKWFDNYPLIVQTGSVDVAAAFHADAALCGAADDPVWGLYAQHVRMHDCTDRIAALHARGIKAMTWLETFGTTQCYIAQLRQAADGSWIRYENSDLTRIFRNHWGWQGFDGSGLIRWISVLNYFDDEDFARPYTRTHPRYGCGPMRYPDGRVAVDEHGTPDDPRTSHVYDAGCAKSVLGQVAIDYDFNAAVNRIDPQTGRPHGSLTGLIEVNKEYSGNFSVKKDSACPVWIDYAHVSALAALDAGIDGFWCDNYSPWDSFGSAPVTEAFGEWSVARFRTYLTQHFSPEQLHRMGVEDAATFDVRAYLRNRCAAWGGNPENLRDRRWKDARWLDDPVWRAYVIYKRQTGSAALSAFYAAIKRAAVESGKPEPLVCGNDIPIFALGWPRGDLDMVSTELSWGWGLTTGPRGLMPPPQGSYVPVYKLAREHARSRFVNVWMYLPDAQLHKPHITEVLFYQGLANDTFPMPHSGGSRTAGGDATNESLFGFVQSIKPVLADRRPVADVGVYFSSSSQLAIMSPGGFVNFDDQPHSFACWGWGTALTELHCQYRAVPEWKLTAAELASLKILVIPDAEVFRPQDVNLPPSFGPFWG